MGLSFHYSARIRAIDQITTLTTEVADICQSLGWQTKLWDQAIEVSPTIAALEPDALPHSIPLKGIAFTPPECDTVWLTFAPSGRLVSLVNLIASEAYDDPNYIYILHVNTQYAGPETHIAIITLLKYLEKKYLTEMEVSDEGEYWESMDKVLLEQRFKDYWSLINMVTDALNNAVIQPSGDPIALAEQIEAILLKRLGGEEPKS